MFNLFEIIEKNIKIIKYKMKTERSLYYKYYFIKMKEANFKFNKCLAKCVNEQSQTKITNTR